MEAHNFRNEEGDFKVYTHLTITPNAKITVRRFLNSIRRTLPNGWHVMRTKYDDCHTFKLITDPTGFELPPFVDKIDNKICRVEMWFGIAGDNMVMLNVSCWKEGILSEEVKIVGYAVWKFHDSILMVSKHYNSFNYDLRYGGRNDAHWAIKDIREKRPLALYSLQDKARMTLSENSKVTLEREVIQFLSPNNIALCLSTSKKSYLRAVETLKAIKSVKPKSKKSAAETTGLVFDFLEDMQSAVIFAYTAVEAFVNVSIPSDFEHTRYNEKGVKEIWSKIQIERWLPTSEKITDVLPLVFKCEPINNQLFWSEFKELEKLRNEIIHQKSHHEDNDSNIVNALFSSKTKGLLEAATKLIDYFYKFREDHHYYPLGIGIASYQVIEIESFEKHFKVIEE